MSCILSSTLASFRADAELEVFQSRHPVSVKRIRCSSVICSLFGSSFFGRRLFLSSTPNLVEGVWFFIGAWSAQLGYITPEVQEWNFYRHMCDNYYRFALDITIATFSANIRWLAHQFKSQKFTLDRAFHASSHVADQQTIAKPIFPSIVRMQAIIVQ